MEDDNDTWTASLLLILSFWLFVVFLLPLLVDADADVLLLLLLLLSLLLLLDDADDDNVFGAIAPNALDKESAADLALLKLLLLLESLIGR